MRRSPLLRIPRDLGQYKADSVWREEVSGRLRCFQGFPAGGELNRQAEESSWQQNCAIELAEEEREGDG